MVSPWQAPEHSTASTWARVESYLETLSDSELNALILPEGSEEARLRDFFKRNRTDYEATQNPSADPRNHPRFHMGIESHYDGGEQDEGFQLTRELEICERWKGGKISA